jgi:hypothetical protein
MTDHEWNRLGDRLFDVLGLVLVATFCLAPIAAFMLAIYIAVKS